jgi:hypothetical protein
MKRKKTAAITLSLCGLVLFSLYAGTARNWRNVIEKGTTEKLPCSVNGTSMTEESLCEGVLSTVLPETVEEKYRNQKEDFSYASAHKESPSGVEESTEAAANAGKSLTIADIRQMEAGSVLDMSGAAADLTESLFYSEELSAEMQQRIMGISYQENDNISLGELRYLRVLHLGFDGQTHIGELLVNASIADEVLQIMRELYANEYAIEKMVLVDAYGADDERSMEDNNTSAFNYREIAGSSKLSRHSLGLAIDINPLYNPCVKNGGASISPVNAGGYADRSQTFAHKIDENDLCYRLFLEHGFTWGGSWHSLKDYQHFEK